MRRLAGMLPTGSVLAASFALALAISAPAPALPTAPLSTANAPIGDCDDTNPAAYPGAAEVADNGIDENCNGLADEAADGTPSSSSNDDDVDGVTVAMGDCNDHAPSVRVGAPEIVGDLIDNDCDGLADEAPDNTPSADTLDHDSDSVPMANVRIFGADFEI